MWELRQLPPLHNRRVVAHPQADDPGGCLKRREKRREMLLPGGELGGGGGAEVECGSVGRLEQQALVADAQPRHRVEQQRPALHAAPAQVSLPQQCLRGEDCEAEVPRVEPLAALGEWTCHQRPLRHRKTRLPRHGDTGQLATSGPHGQQHLKEGRDGEEDTFIPI